MTPKTLWISLYGILLISSILCSRRKLKRRKVPPQIREWATPDFNKEERFTTRKTTPMFVHQKRSYSIIGFENISATGTFVDKTMMIERFFETYPFHMVTFPHLFGKTINLDMIYRFASIELNKTGIPLEKQFTASYSLFSNRMEICKQREDLIQDHLAEYPVLYLNMKGFFMGLRESEERMDSMSHILKWCVAEYQVLLDRELMRKNRSHAENFKFIRKAFDKELSYVEMENSLYEFSRVFHNHFNKKVILLIDNFDYPFNSAVSKGIGYEIIELLVIMLDRLFHPLDDQCHVAYALITGISNTMATLINTKVPEIMHHRAFENHIFAPFYGITDEDLGVLMYHPKLTYTDRLRIPQYYTGYLIRDTNHLVANPFSVTEHINEDCMWYNPWFGSQSISTFVDFLKNKQIYEYMLQFVFLKVVEIELLPCIGLEDMNELWRIEHTRKDASGLDPRVFFSFFFEYGYLSYTEQDNLYRIPNEEISDGLKYFMVEFYDSTIEKTDLHKWDEKLILREVFETGNVTDEMLDDLQNYMRNLITRSKSFNISEDLKLLQYQSLIYYNARKFLENIYVRTELYVDSVNQPVYIIMINFQAIMALFIGLSENESAQEILNQVHSYAIPYDTNTPAQMIKYIGISVNGEEPCTAYNSSGSIEAENYHVLLTTTTPLPTTKKRRRNYTRSTAPTYASFPRMPKKMRELFWFDGRAPPKKANTAIDAMY